MQRNQSRNEKDHHNDGFAAATFVLLSCLLVRSTDFISLSFNYRLCALGIFCIIIQKQKKFPTKKKGKEKERKRRIDAL